MEKDKLDLDFLNSFHKNNVNGFEKYKDIFVENDDFDDGMYGKMKILHNFSGWGTALSLRFLNLFEEDNDKEFLSIDEDSFGFIYMFIQDYYPDFDEYDLVNTIKYDTMNKICCRLFSVIKDLRNEANSEDSNRVISKGNLYCLDEKFCYELTNDGRREFLFQNKQKLIDFYEAFIWYIFVYKHYGFQDMRVLNFAGF